MKSLIYPDRGSQYDDIVATIKALDKAVTYNSMEFASLVPLRKPLCVLRLASTVLAEVFGSLWYDVGE